MNNEINTSELLTAIAKMMELYSHDEGAELAKETAYNLALIEEAESIIRNS